MLIQVLAGVAGVPVYFITKAACHVANLGRARRPLKTDVVSLMRGHLPEIDYSRVRVVFGASLPANWLRWIGGARRLTADGMTFGSTIFLRQASLELLLHELVHVDQVRRFGGEPVFAYRYAMGFLGARGYRDNPLEAEAYEFVARCAATLPSQWPHQI